MFKYAKVLFLAISFLTACPSYAVTIGDPAPALQNVQWMKNGPVDILQGKGKLVYVIEFWATWCPPCVESIPHLTELQGKYRKQGLVIAGISIDGDIRVAQEFTLQNAEMKYNVGFDTDGSTSKEYMTENSGIPTAFVIDKNGTVAWIGHPMELDNILEAVLAGTFDAKKANQRLQLSKKIMQQMMSENYGEALKLCDELLKLDPGSEQAVGMKAYLLHLAGKDDAAIDFVYGQIKEHPDKTELINTKFSILIQLKKYQCLDKECDSPSISLAEPMVLNTIVLGMINPAPGRQKDVMILQVALKLAETAYSKCNFKSDEQKSLSAATLASCYFELNKTAKAVEMLKLSLGLTKDKSKIEILEKTLKEYQTAARDGIDK
ncbi:MAG: redoxin domain-containing protein [Victivallaceae bacterium]|jgi:thiol-disulfide isomerase/thioredoxin